MLKRLSLATLLCVVSLSACTEDTEFDITLADSEKLVIDAGAFQGKPFKIENTGKVSYAITTANDDRCDIGLLTIDDWRNPSSWNYKFKSYDFKLQHSTAEITETVSTGSYVLGFRCINSDAKLPCNLVVNLRASFVIK